MTNLIRLPHDTIVNKEIDNSVLAPFGRMIQKPQAKWIALTGLVVVMVAQYFGY